MLFWDRWRIAGSRGRFLLLGEFDDVVEVGLGYLFGLGLLFES